MRRSIECVFRSCAGIDFAYISNLARAHAKFDEAGKELLAVGEVVEKCFATDEVAKLEAKLSVEAAEKVVEAAQMADVRTGCR